MMKNEDLFGFCVVCALGGLGAAPESLCTTIKAETRGEAPEIAIVQNLLHHSWKRRYINTLEYGR